MLRSALKDLEAVVCHQPSFEPFSDVRTFQIAANDNGAAPGETLARSSSGAG